MIRVILLFTMKNNQKPKESKGIKLLESVRNKSVDSVKKMTTFAIKKYKESQNPKIQEARLRQTIKLETQRQKLAKLRERANRIQEKTRSFGYTNPLESIGSFRGNTSPLGEFTRKKRRR